MSLSNTWHPLAGKIPSQLYSRSVAIRFWAGLRTCSQSLHRQPRHSRIVAHLAGHEIPALFETRGDSIQKFSELFRRRFPQHMPGPEIRVFARHCLEFRFPQMLTHFRHRQHPRIERLQQNAE